MTQPIETERKWNDLKLGLYQEKDKLCQGLLNVVDLNVTFHTWGKPAYALRGIHFQVREGETSPLSASQAAVKASRPNRLWATS